uniref:Uncharacterized protein n=1 Tax=Ciona intestinalis TaxID=7719 RepID=H2XSE3_CIOIN
MQATRGVIGRFVQHLFREVTQHWIQSCIVGWDGIENKTSSKRFQVNPMFVLETPDELTRETDR